MECTEILFFLTAPCNPGETFTCPSCNVKLTPGDPYSLEERCDIETTNVECTATMVYLPFCCGFGYYWHMTIHASESDKVEQTENKVWQLPNSYTIKFPTASECQQWLHTPQQLVSKSWAFLMNLWNDNIFWVTHLLVLSAVVLTFWISPHQSYCKTTRYQRARGDTIQLIRECGSNDTCPSVDYLNDVNQPVNELHTRDCEIVDGIPGNENVKRICTACFKSSEPCAPPTREWQWMICIHPFRTKGTIAW